MRSLVLCIVVAFAALVAKTPLFAQSEAANAFIPQLADSALMDILNSESSKAQKWADVMMTVAADSDMVCISQCLRTCVTVSNGSTSGLNAISEAVRHFAYRKDATAQTGLAIAYCALGYYEYECSPSPNDIYFKKAERLAKTQGNTRLEMLILAFRTQMYIRSQRFIEASYCARSLSAASSGADYADLQLLARLYMLRVYSAVRMESAVSLCADAIEVNPLFDANPVYAAMFSKVMAVDRVRSREYGEANVYSWSAYRIGNKYPIARTEKWSRAFIRAVTLFYSGHVEEAKAMADSCKKYSYLVSSRTFVPYESPYSLDLLLAQIEQEMGNVAAAKSFLDNVRIPKELMRSNDFIINYYELVERNAVSRGDFALARRAVISADSVTKHAQLVNTRILCKDMWLSSQEDSLVANKIKTVKSDEVKAESHEGVILASAFAFMGAALFIVGYGVWRVRRKGKNTLQSDIRINVQLSDEIDSSAKLIEQQNVLISKRNLDIAASRTYAKRMQRGIWPNPDKLITMGMPHSFVLRGTTEYVSSCFYWYHKVGDMVIVCCADSGFGNSVAGAMLSVLGLTLFNDAVSKMAGSTSAADLLRIVDANFVACLPDEDWRGGISASVAVVNTAERHVNVACASADALILNNGKATAVSDSQEKVGRFNNSHHRVKEHGFNYSQGDSVFLFTQHFVQVANVAGEPLGLDRFKAIIERSVKLPSNLYHDAILNEIMFWRSSRPFSDDVLLVGFTLP